MSFVLRLLKVEISAPSHWSDGHSEQVYAELDGLTEKVENVVRNVIADIDDELTVEVKE